MPFDDIPIIGAFIYAIPVVIVTALIMVALGFWWSREKDDD